MQPGWAHAQTNGDGSHQADLTEPQSAEYTKEAESVRQKRLSAQEMRRVSYLGDTAFQGYVVGSRYSGLNLALEVPNRLLAIARNNGLADAEDLSPTDFFPGTIDGYQNPYHYDLRPWQKLKTGLGKYL